MNTHVNTHTSIHRNTKIHINTNTFVNMNVSIHVHTHTRELDDVHSLFFDGGSFWSLGFRFLGVGGLASGVEGPVTVLV